MRYQRTQISLEPDQHRKLVDEAAARGISLAELLRLIVREHVREQAAPYKAKSWDAITGIVVLDEETDIVANWDEYLGEAFEANYERKIGRDPGPPPPPKPPR